MESCVLAMLAVYQALSSSRGRWRKAAMVKNVLDFDTWARLVQNIFLLRKVVHATHANLILSSLQSRLTYVSRYAVPKACIQRGS